MKDPKILIVNGSGMVDSVFHMYRDHYDLTEEQFDQILERVTDEELEEIVDKTSKAKDIIKKHLA